MLMNSGFKISKMLVKNRFSSLSLVNTMKMFATARRYTHDHEWVEFNANTNEGKIGITSYAQEQLGDIVFVDLPETGTSHNKGDSMCGIESVKTAADLYAPAKLEIIERNENLSSNPGLLNTASETDGWIFKVKIESERELGDLMSEEDYRKFVEEAKAAH